MGVSSSHSEQVNILVLSSRCCGISWLIKRLGQDPASYSPQPPDMVPTCGFESSPLFSIQLGQKDKVELALQGGTIWNHLKEDLKKQVIACTQGMMLVYDATCTESFEEIKAVVDYVSEHAPQVKMMLVGTKSDLPGRCDRLGYCSLGADCQRADRGAADEFAISHAMPCLEVSALDGTNIGKALMTICSMVRRDIPGGPSGRAARLEARLAWEESVRVRLQSESAKSISFSGSVTNDPQTRCIVSYPGVYGQGWNNLVNQSASGQFSTACVFLPEGDPLNGEHVPNEEEPETGCYCVKLYGKAQPWGCAWFKQWKENVEKARAIGQPLWVIYFLGQVGTGDHLGWEELASKGYSALRDNTGLGASQKGEVAWLKRCGYQFHKRDVILSDDPSLACE